MRTSMFASSSHTGFVGEFRRYLQGLLERLRWNAAAEALIDLVQTHACAEAFEEMRYRQARSADGGLTTQPLRIGNDPAIVFISQWLFNNRCLIGLYTRGYFPFVAGGGLSGFKLLVT